jgi:hypothetical protein
MQRYILSDWEKKIINEYLTTGVKLDGFRIVIFRIKKHRERIESDYNMLQQFMENVESGPKK